MPKSRNRKNHKQKVAAHKQKAGANKKEALRLLEEFRKTGVMPKFVVGAQEQEPEISLGSQEQNLSDFAPSASPTLFL